MRILAGAELLTGHGGQDRSLLELVEALRADDHQVHVTYRVPGPFFERYASAGATLDQVANYMVTPGDAWRTGWRFLEAVGRGWVAAPDVVYLNQLTDSPWGAAVSVLRRRPLVCHLRLPPPRRFGIQWKSALPAVTRFVAVSEFTRRQHVAEGIDPDAIDVVPNGVDPHRYRPPDRGERLNARIVFGVDPDAPVVVYLGRLDVGKGLETLLAAWPLVRGAAPTARLLIAGAPHFHERGNVAAREYAAGLRAGCEDDVVWVGHQTDVRPLLWAADLVVVPSEWPEPSGRCILEAQSAGIPVVCSDAGGMAELLPANERPFPAGDAVALADAVCRRLGWREDVPTLGEQVREHVSRTFGLRQTAERMVEVFERAIVTARPQRRGHVHGLGAWERSRPLQPYDATAANATK